MEKATNKPFFSRYRIIILVFIAVIIVWQCRYFIFPRNRIQRVILISIDTCRADYLGCYGYPENTTPNIDELAKEGILFENVVSPVPYTLPAHSSIFTGTIPPYHGVHDNKKYRLDEANVTLAEMLQKRGYKTCGIVSTIVLESELGIAQGFDDYYDYRKTVAPGTPLPTVEKKAEHTTQKALDWLEENKDDSFFMFLHYYDPHTPYEPPEPFAAKFADNLYAGEIAYVDHYIGKVISKLKELGLYDSSLLVIVGDHGEGLWEHDESQHGFFIYQTTLSVPLIFKLPGQTESRRVSDLVSLVDITPTVCSLVGVSVPKEVSGRDLSPYLRGEPVDGEKRYIYAESLGPTLVTANSLLGIIEGEWKYIQTTRPELYNLKADPGETTNLVDAEPQRARILKEQLKIILDDQLQVGRGRHEPDAQRLERLRTLGYVGGTVDETFDFDQTKEDPKDLIWLQEQMLVLEDALEKNDRDKVKEVCTYVLSRKSDFRDGHKFLAKIAKDKGDFPEAERHWKESLKLKSDEASVLDSLGKVLAFQNKTEEAVKYWYKALEVQPGNDETHYNLAVAFERLGKHDSAIKHWNKSLELNPNQQEITDKLAEEHKKFANNFYMQKKLAKAVEHWGKSVKLKPDQPDLLNNLSWAYTVKGQTFYNPKEAVRLAQRACELTSYKNPSMLDTLATAYASQENFTKAIETLQKAIELASSAGQTQLLTEFQKRLKSYKSEQPKN